MKRALVFALLVLAASNAWANGRDPYTSTIHFQRGAEQNIYAGMTFGLLVSHDNGATWQWMCEKAVGYGGLYDPDYQATPGGALFATTFDGLKVMRDGCSFTATPPGMTFVTRVMQTSNGAIYFASSDPNDTNIYRSTDDGMTFPTAASVGIANEWWQSLEGARSDPDRIYLSGYRLVMKCTANSTNPGIPCTQNPECGGVGTCEPQKDFLLYKSTNATTAFTFSAMSMTGINMTSTNSIIDIVGVSAVDADTIFIKVSFETGTIGDTIYRSTNGGTSWMPILSRASNFGLSFLIRSDGTCVAGTREMGAWKSMDCATAATPAWTQLTNAPHIGCLVENSAGEVWACTQNTAVMQSGIEADGFAIMKSTDLATWTGVMRFEDIQAPVTCAVGTAQNDQCVERYMDQQSPWCCLTLQLSITSTAIDCTGARGCFGIMPDGAVDAPSITKPSDSGCCDSGAGAGSAFALGGVSMFALFRRRRRKH